MTESYIGWALVVGMALGAALVWFVLGRLPRRSDDVGPEERAEEAYWISRAIESRGGVAPPALVEEVLELHLTYVDGPPLDVRPATTDADATEAAATVPPQAEVAAEERGQPTPQPVEPVAPSLPPPREVVESELADEDRRAV